MAHDAAKENSRKTRNAAKTTSQKSARKKFHFAGWTFNVRRAGVAKHYETMKKVVGADECVLCNLTKWHNEIVRETEYFYIAKNHFPYYLWQSQRVLEHLMLIPKNHRGSIRDFTNAEAAEFAKLLGEYESADYQIDARSPQNVFRSQPHQHTHLIKVRHKIYARRRIR